MGQVLYERQQRHVGLLETDTAFSTWRGAEQGRLGGGNEAGEQGACAKCKRLCQPPRVCPSLCAGTSPWCMAWGQLLLTGLSLGRLLGEHKPGESIQKQLHLKETCLSASVGWQPTPITEPDFTDMQRKSSE